MQIVGGNALEGPFTTVTSKQMVIWSDEFSDHVVGSNLARSFPFPAEKSPASTSRTINHIGVVISDTRGGIDRIEARQVGLRDDAQYFFCRRRHRRARNQRKNSRERQYRARNQEPESMLYE